MKLRRFIGVQGRGKRMKISKYSLAAVLVLTALMAVGCSVLPTPQPPPTFVPPATPSPSYDSEVTENLVYVVKRGNIEETTEIRGRVVATQEEFLSFPLSGWLKEVHIRAGDKVEAGVLLAELDAVGLSNTVSDAEYNLEQAKLLAELDAVGLRNTVSDAEYGLEQAKLRLEQARARPT